MIKDLAGNTLFRQGFNIKLMLASEPYARTLGTIHEESRTLIVRRDSKKHFFYKSSSYGFNDTLLRTASKFDTIQLVVDGNLVYNIPRMVILERGQYLQFSQQGFEIQVFLKQSIIDQYRIQ